MSGLLEAVYARGEYVSLLVVSIVLVALVGRTALLLRLDAGRVGDLWWSGGIAFVLVGRAAFLLRESPQTLLDPLVAIRLQGGIVPLAGVAGVLLVCAWLGRHEATPARLRLLAAAAAGLVIATIAYDLACLARDACGGRAAPPPLGISLPGLTQPRLPTPLIEAALLLVAGGVLLRSLRPVHAAVAAGGVAAWSHAALAAASTRGTAALGTEAAGFALLGTAALMWVVWRVAVRAPGVEDEPAEETSATA